MKYLVFRLNHVVTPDHFNHFTVEWEDSWLVVDPASLFEVIKADPGDTFVLWAQDRAYRDAFFDAEFDMEAYLKQRLPDFILAKSSAGAVLVIDQSSEDEIKDLEVSRHG